MSDTIISVEQLGKKYRIDHLAEKGQYKTLRETITSGTRGLLTSWSSNGADRAPKRGREEFWALKDISFQVKEGEVLGIIGRNGAGKSTLLKILSRITEPTEGRVRIRGRVASLLEVGTGFHPELTGSENIYLNGAILGMSRAEIKRKFDEIVDFAGTEKFLDTPVKRYSSGMHVRLAFAVAAHLESEILIVDEVLSVGDASFQKKCLGKMQDVSRTGRTVLFVSHNMNATESLCQRIVRLDGGRVLTDTNDLGGAIAAYLSSGSNFTAASEWRNPGDTLRNQWFYPTRFYLGDESGRVLSGPARNDSSIYVYIEGEVDEKDIALQVGYGLFDEPGTLLYWSEQIDMPEAEWPRLKKGLNLLRSQLPMQTLNQGVYRLDLLIALYHRRWISEPGRGVPGITLTIQGGLSDSPYWMEKRPGILAPVCRWTVGEPNGFALADDGVEATPA